MSIWERADPTGYRIRPPLSSRMLGLALVVLFSVIPVQTGHTHHYFPLQPGAPVGVDLDTTCTFNFVFRDRSEGGATYIGTAGHCVQGVGSRAEIRDVREFGTVVFRARHEGSDESSAMDFALIRIDEDKLDLVDPSVRFWGGPTRVAGDAQPYDPTMHYGHGLGFRATEATRPRVGFLNYVKHESFWGPQRGWFVAVHPIMGGDSGSGMLSGDGEALGVLTHLAAADRGIVSGPTLSLIFDHVSAAGFDVELVTAPFPPRHDASELGRRITDTAQHCASRPVARDHEPEGCMWLPS